jgi:hypothetical protein
MDHFVKEGNTELPPWHLDYGHGEAAVEEDKE